MKEEFTDEEKVAMVRKIIAEAKRLNQHTFDLRYKRMCKAEDELVCTFNEEQRELYKKFCKKRDAFYQAADKVYIKY